VESEDIGAFEAQAVIHGYPLVSRDRVFRKYGVKTLW
jgi:hypothetical protein